MHLTCCCSQPGCSAARQPPAQAGSGPTTTRGDKLPVRATAQGASRKVAPPTQHSMRHTIRECPDVPSSTQVGCACMHAHAQQHHCHACLARVEQGISAQQRNSAQIAHAFWARHAYSPHPACCWTASNVHTELTHNGLVTQHKGRSLHMHEAPVAMALHTRQTPARVCLHTHSEHLAGQAPYLAIGVGTPSLQ
jgi:hypothetical protein